MSYSEKKAEQPMTARVPGASSAMEALDGCLSNFEQLVDVLRNTVDPVRSSRPEDTVRAMSGVVEPQTALRGRIQRFDELLGRLSAVISEIDL